MMSSSRYTVTSIIFSPRDRKRIVTLLLLFGLAFFLSACDDDVSRSRAIIHFGSYTWTAIDKPDGLNYALMAMTASIGNLAYDETIPFNNDWTTSTLNMFLNGDFYDDNFFPYEKNVIPSVERINWAFYHSGPVDEKIFIPDPEQITAAVSPSSGYWIEVPLDGGAENRFISSADFGFAAVSVSSLHPVIPLLYIDGNKVYFSSSLEEGEGTSPPDTNGQIQQSVDYSFNPHRKLTLLSPDLPDFTCNETTITSSANQTITLTGVNRPTHSFIRMLLYFDSVLVESDDFPGIYETSEINISGVMDYNETTNTATIKLPDNISQNVTFNGQPAAITTAKIWYENNFYNNTTTNIAGLAKELPITINTYYTVSLSFNAEFGSVSPDTPQVVLENDTLHFTIIPKEGYYLESVTGNCGGTLEGNIFTTEMITQNCLIVTNFIKKPSPWLLFNSAINLAIESQK